MPNGKRRASHTDVAQTKNGTAKRAKATASSISPTKGSSSSNVEASGDRQIDANGDIYWNISRMRRVTVSSFSNRLMVSVREYYEKDGQVLPGKKGISMPLDQYNAFVKLLPDIEVALKEKGEAVTRPNYGNKGEDEEEESEEGEGDGGSASDDESE